MPACGLSAETPYERTVRQAREIAERLDAEQVQPVHRLRRDIEQVGWQRHALATPFDRHARRSPAHDRRRQARARDPVYLREPPEFPARYRTLRDERARAHSAECLRKGHASLNLG